MLTKRHDYALHVLVIQHADDRDRLALVPACPQYVGQCFGCRRVVRHIQQPFGTILLDALSATRELDLRQHCRDEFRSRRRANARGTEQCKYRRCIACLELTGQPRLRHSLKRKIAAAKQELRPDIVGLRNNGLAGTSVLP